MPDFDANEDPAMLPAHGQEKPVEPAEQGLPVIRRAREMQGRHGDESSPPRRPDRRLRAPRPQAERRPCNRSWRACALRSLPRSRRLWTKCHGRLPGSPS